MTVFTEGSLQITVDSTVNARKFDGASHGLSHCMKAVDFIIDLPDSYLFIEFKDPQDPAVPAQDAKDYLENFKKARSTRISSTSTGTLSSMNGHRDGPISPLIT